jgi:hypothetical protein
MKTPRHKIYYTGGLISLILLPVLCIIYIKKVKPETKFNVIEINWWTPNWNRLDTYNRYPFEVHPPRQFLDIILTGNDKEDKTKLDFAQLEIRRLLLLKDTIRGIHFLFTDNSKYESFIRVLNICIREKAKMYVVKGNEVWYFNFYPKPIPAGNPFRMDCGGNIKSSPIVSKEEINLIDKISQEINAQFLYAIVMWPPVLLFFALVSMVILRISQSK